MYIISGTKRSGTSMWMQALAAAGLSVDGAAFPKAWGQGSLREANPDGFYEGPFRHGIFFATNPDPATGRYLTPEATAGTVTKVFVPGLIRTERPFIERVIANVRQWRDYEASIARLWDLDDQQRLDEGSARPAEIRLPAALEWWVENFGLLRDQAVRGYPLQLQTYEQVLADPERYVGAAIDFLGEGDREAALAAIKPERRTRSGTPSSSLPTALARSFDDLYEAVERGGPLSSTLMKQLEGVHREVMPRWAELKLGKVRTLMEGGAPPPPLMVMAASMS